MIFIPLLSILVTFFLILFIFYFVLQRKKQGNYEQFSIKSEKSVYSR